MLNLNRKDLLPNPPETRQGLAYKLKIHEIQSNKRVYKYNIIKDVCASRDYKVVHQAESHFDEKIQMA